MAFLLGLDKLMTSLLHIPHDDREEVSKNKKEEKFLNMQ
jgi:hypothetical protein